MKVFFPGKFQPPHIGHVLTISKLLNQGHRVIIGISQDKPRVISQEKVKGIFDMIFSSFDTSCFLFEGALTDYKEINDFPEFDILVSANPKVIDWALKLGLNVRLCPRSEGIGHSGTELRKLCKK